MVELNERITLKPWNCYQIVAVHVIWFNVLHCRVAACDSFDTTAHWLAWGRVGCWCTLAVSLTTMKGCPPPGVLATSWCHLSTLRQALLYNAAFTAARDLETVSIDNNLQMFIFISIFEKLLKHGFYWIAIYIILYHTTPDLIYFIGI